LVVSGTRPHDLLLKSAMGYECFDVEITDKVAHVRLNRPDAMNSMVPAFWMELPQIVREIDDEASARVIVISSTGKHFSAGMDLAVFTGGGGGGDNPLEGKSSEAGRRRAYLRQSAMMLQESFSAFEKARMPVLAAIQGGCVGGAVDMVTACDSRYATEDAFFVIQEINIGMTADVGTLQRLPKLIPEGVARELAYTGRRMPAARAKEVGLVNEVFATQDEMLAAVLTIAAEIASKSPLAIWGTKEMINYTRDHSVADALNYIATWQTGMFQPGDMMESFAAKGEKRDPAFDDLLPNPKEF
jgi:enoyl-CoA hydratase